MATPERRPPRVFKTEWFSKAASKAQISDDELCKAIHQVMLGQADDLGGGVFKKRLGKNLFRSIVLAKVGRNWIYVFLYAKNNRANISNDELIAFRKLAEIYSRASDGEIAEELKSKELLEICDGEKSQV